MNFSKFKKVGANKSHTIFQHPDGHTIHVAHTSVKPELKGALKELPLQRFYRGGQVKPVQQPIQQPQPNPYPQQTLPSLDKDKLRDFKPFYDGGEVNVPWSPEPGVNPIGANNGLPEGIPQQPDPNQVFNQIPGFQEQSNAANLAARAQADKSSQQASALSSHMKQEAEASQRMQDSFRERLQQIQDVSDDIKNGHINPNQYMENLGVGGKVLTAIGLMLGGYGTQGHGSNHALEFLNSQINRDLESQKANLSNKNNLLSALHNQYQDEMEAENMFKAIRAKSLADQVELAAAKSGTPLAQAQALDFKGKMMQQYLPVIRKLHMISALSKAEGSPDGVAPILSHMRNFDPAMAKDLEGRYVPGVGVGSVPVPEKIRDTLTARQSLQDAVGELRKWTSENSGSVDPAVTGYGQALARQVQDAYRRANGQGVFKESEAHFVNSIVSDKPDAFFAKYRTDPGYKALEKTNLDELNAVKKSHGLPVKNMEQQKAGHMSPQEKTFLNWANNNPNDPRSSLVKQKLGVK